MPETSQARRTTFAEFQEARYFPELDGLRAISVLMVLAVHTGGWLWRPVHGHLGVTIFFVISGFLITTLLMRENRATGSVSFRSFYLRRIFRILPLYYLALALFSLLVLAGFGDSPGQYGHRMLYFLGYLNEFAGPGTFGHSWSLGIEEKFYLLWPLVAFGVPFLARFRSIAGALLLVLATATVAWDPQAYLAIYVPIIAGCCLALAMDNAAGFQVAAFLARPAIGLAAVAVAVVCLIFDDRGGFVHVGFALAAALAFPVFMVGRPGARRWLTLRPMRFVGQRSYAVYLFHPLVLSCVDIVVPQSERALFQVLRMALVVAGSLVAADVLFRVWERPLIRYGRRVIERVERRRRAAVAIPVHREPAIAPAGDVSSQR